MSDGNVANGCQGYYYCVYTGKPYETIVDFACPSGLVFDSTARVCNLPSKVTCKA